MLSQELANRLQTQGWNDGIQACINIICPTPHKEEERTCEEIATQLRKLLKPITLKLKDTKGTKHSFYLETWGNIT